MYIKSFSFFLMVKDWIFRGWRFLIVYLFVMSQDRGRRTKNRESIPISLSPGAGSVPKRDSKFKNPGAREILKIKCNLKETKIKWWIEKKKRWNGKTDSKAPLPRNKRGYNGDPFGIEKKRACGNYSCLSFRFSPYGRRGSDQEVTLPMFCRWLITGLVSQCKWTVCSSHSCRLSTKTVKRTDKEKKTTF
jgi:hypothetical protein